MARVSTGVDRQCLERVGLFLAVSPALESALVYAGALHRSLTALRVDGRFETIMQAYGPSDWAPGR